MNTVMPSIPTPDVLAAIAPRPTPVRATDASAVADPARAAANAGRDRDAARGERDFASRLAHEMRAETAENAAVRERRTAPAQARDARRDRGDDVRTTPAARGDEGREPAVEDAPAGAAATRERGDDAGGDEPPPGGKELPPWLTAELVQARPVPVTTQPPAMLDAEPVALAAGGNASALAFDVAAESAMAGAVATPNAGTGASATATAAATAAVVDPDVAAQLATTDPTVAEPELPVPGAPSANPAVTAGADAATPRALPAAASEVARLLAQARDAERLDTLPADAAKSSARALPEAAPSPGAPPNARPAPVVLPAAVANAAPAGRSFTLSAAAATAPAAASVGAEAAVAPPAAPRVELAGPFALTLAGASAPATAAPAAVPAQLQLSTPLDAPEWGQQLGDRVNWLVSQDLTNAQLKLTPAHLGPIEIRISLADDQANVWFGTHSQVTREALEAAAPKLREMLAAQGYAQVNVGVNVDVSQQAFRERSQTASRYEPGAPLAADESMAAPAAAPGTRAAGPRSRLDAYA